MSKHLTKTEDMFIFGKKLTYDNPQLFPNKKVPCKYHMPHFKYIEPL